MLLAWSKAGPGSRVLVWTLEPRRVMLTDTRKLPGSWPRPCWWLEPRALKGASQPWELLPLQHPSACPCQVWASNFLPNEARLEDRTQREHLQAHGQPLLLEYGRLEAQRKVGLKSRAEPWLWLGWGS